MHSQNLKRKILRCFNRSADVYDENCQVQLEIGLSLIELLQRFNASFNYGIDLGCGSGLVTTLCAKVIDCQTFVAIDMASNPLHKAQQRLKTTNIALMHADYDFLPIADESMDVVFSNMSLQWSVDLFRTFEEVYRIMKKNSYLAFSLPVAGTFCDLSRELLKINHNYVPNHFINREELKSLLKKAGFIVKQVKSMVITPSYPTLLGMIQAIKNTGANAVVQPKIKSLSGKSYLAKIIARTREEKSFFTLTYSIACIIAEKIS